MVQKMPLLSIIESYTFIPLSLFYHSPFSQVFESCMFKKPFLIAYTMGYAEGKGEAFSLESAKWNYTA
jgi:hypothetical protein